MIYRKQTLYFLAVAIIAFMLIWTDPVYFTSNRKDAGVNVGLVEVGFSNTVLKKGDIVINNLLSSTLFTIGTLSFVAIFFFKNRRIQRLITIINALLILALPFIMYKYSLGMSYFNDPVNEFKMATLIPLSLLLFNYLAYAGIQKDERLVRSVDRIR
jgi:hypothetical protein